LFGFPAAESSPTGGSGKVLEVPYALQAVVKGLGKQAY